MGKFLETHSLSGLNHEEIECLNKSITIKVKSVIKKLSAKKIPRPDCFTGVFYQNRIGSPERNPHIYGQMIHGHLWACLVSSFLRICLQPWRISYSIPKTRTGPTAGWGESSKWLKNAWCYLCGIQLRFHKLILPLWLHYFPKKKRFNLWWCY